MAKSAGGGINSRVVKHTTAHKQEPRPRAVSPAATAQLGSKQGNHSTVQSGPMKTYGASVPLFQGRGYQTPVGPKPCGEGPGAGRVIMKTGTQSQHGAASGQRPSPGRPIDGPSPFHNREDRS
jgi:hypothetical protein